MSARNVSLGVPVVQPGRRYATFRRCWCAMDPTAQPPRPVVGDDRVAEQLCGVNAGREIIRRCAYPGAGSR